MTIEKLKAASEKFTIEELNQDLEDTKKDLSIFEGKLLANQLLIKSGDKLATVKRGYYEGKVKEAKELINTISEILNFKTQINND